MKLHHSEHETFTQSWFNVGPASQTVGKHWTNIGWTSRLCWARWHVCRDNDISLKDLLIKYGVMLQLPPFSPTAEIGLLSLCVLQLSTFMHCRVGIHVVVISPHLKLELHYYSLPYHHIISYQPKLAFKRQLLYCNFGPRVGFYSNINKKRNNFMRYFYDRQLLMQWVEYNAIILMHLK